jgi:ribonucleotide reductase beta subunit family protein with ferritin-like domain
MDFTDPKHKRFVLHPIQHHKLWDLFKQQQQVLWTTEEIDFTQDRLDWTKMDKETQDFMLTIIAFFAGSDILIIDNCMDQFLSEVTVAECKMFYSLQAFVESIHSETYSTMLSEFGGGRFNELRNAIVNIPSIKGKADWARKYMDKSQPYGVRLLAFTIFEGVLFSASFCSIYWLRTKNLCHGLTYSNELIARDEALHATFGVEMFNMLRERPSDEKIKQVLDEAITLEMNFVDEALPKKLSGINAKSMKEYVKYVGDHLLQRLKVKAAYGAANPYPWMDMISIDSKSNFFEKRVAEYSLSTVGNNAIENGFAEDEDF